MSWISLNYKSYFTHVQKRKHYLCYYKLAIFINLEMTQFWSVNYICQVCKLKLLFRTCLKFWTMFILIGSYFQLLLNIYYRRSTAILFGTVLFDTFWWSWKLLFFEENIFKVFSSYIYVVFLSKNHELP